MVEFFQLLASNTPTKEGPDGLRWKGRKDGVFASCFFFYHLLNERLGEPFPWKGIWAAKAPPRVSFFIWTATWGRILVITLCGEDTQWWASVVCVVPIGRQSIISCYIALFRMCYGAFFSVRFMLIGLFHGM